MTTQDTERLAELIHRKRHCLLQLRTVGQKQLELVCGGNISDLLDLLAAKQQVVLQLHQIERALEPFRNQDPEARPWSSPQARQACAGELADCEALLADVVRQEHQSEQELTRRRDEAAAQLAGMHAAGRARRAYLAQPPDAPARLDMISGEL